VSVLRGVIEEMDAGAGRALEQPVEDHRASDPMKQEGAQAPANTKDKDLTVDVTVGSVDFDVIVKEGSDEMTRIDVSLERVLEVLRKAVRKRPRGIP